MNCNTKYGVGDGYLVAGWRGDGVPVVKQTVKEVTWGLQVDL